MNNSLIPDDFEKVRAKLVQLEKYKGTDLNSGSDGNHKPKRRRRRVKSFKNPRRLENDSEEEEPTLLTMKGPKMPELIVQVRAFCYDVLTLLKVFF